MSLPTLNLKGEFLPDKNDKHDKASLSSQSEAILELFSQSNDIIQEGRNILKKVIFNGRPCVVKSFRIPTFPQNYSYGLVDKSKAEKSYENAQQLLELGFSTPKPIGFFEFHSKGKLKASYYICEYAEGMKTMHDLEENNNGLDDTLIKSFASFCYRLHSQGILHRDFNSKNILISQNNEQFDFALVDINRITWYKKLSLKKSMESLSRLPYSDLVLETYVELAGADIDHCTNLLKKSVQKSQRYFRNKKRLRQLFPKK